MILQVQWGDKGCTEAGSHLEKDKNDKLIKVNEEGGSGGASPSAKPGCLELIKVCIRSFQCHYIYKIQ